MSPLSRLYAFMYWSKRHSLLGCALGLWLRLLPFALALAGWALAWPLPLTLFWLLLGVLLVISYALGRRAGYTQFRPDPTMALDDDFAIPHFEQRVPLRATGLFSVRDREAYLLERPATYWHVRHGQHVFMAEEQPGRYLYQIVEPQLIRAVEPGHLLFGRRPQPALALHFIPSWGPQFAVEPSYYDMEPVEAPADDREKRTVYLTFDHDADRYAVWKSLLQTEKTESPNS